jgi:DNA-binding transcriptional regulator GbsR (MarR family)
METWVQLPLWWVSDSEDSSFLKKLNWNNPGANSHNTAALMVLLAIATNTSHRQTHKNPIIGSVDLSFTDLTNITLLSRKLISEGLKKLIESGLIKKSKARKVNQYTLLRTSSSEGWGKLPAKKLYESNLESIKAFKHFKMRSKVELNALKIYFLIVALRGNETNYSQMTYDTITRRTGVRRADINGAISLLVSSELIRVIKLESMKNKYATVNAYRLIGIDSYKHEGTSGKIDIDNFQVESA